MEILAIGYIVVCIIASIAIIRLQNKNRRQQFTIENLTEIINSKADWKIKIGKSGYMEYEPGSSASNGPIYMSASKAPVVEPGKIIEYTPIANYTTQIFKKKGKE